MNRCLCALALVFALTPMAPAQRGRPAPKPTPEQAAVGPPRDAGTQLFRGLLHHNGIEPLAPRNPEYTSGTMVIVLGDPGRNRLLTAWHVRNTLAKGGAVLIATDLPIDLSTFLPDGEDVRIVGSPILDPGGRNAYRSDASFPFAVPTGDGIGEEERPFAAFARVATNGPSALRIAKRPPYLTRTIAKFPAGAVYSTGNPPNRNDAFAASGVGPPRDPFRFLVMADRDVLTNDMLYSSIDKEATDNFAFAVRLVPWLQGPEKRRQCLFIEDGEAKARFDEFDFAQVRSQNPAMPPIPPLKRPDLMDRRFQEGSSKAIAESAARAEDSDAMRNGLAKDNGLYLALMGTLAVVLAILAGIVLRVRIRRSLLARDYRPIPVDPLRLGGDAALGSFEHRRLELLRGSDFRAPFAEFAMQLFAERGLPPMYAGRRCPKIDATGRTRRHLTESIRRLWEEAYTRIGVPMPYSKWKEIEPILTAVRSAALADLWRFAPES